jgi:hypothetical protein
MEHFKKSKSKKYKLEGWLPSETSDGEMLVKEGKLSVREDE